MPKIELHAHINGSIRVSTLQSLCSKYSVPFDSAIFSSNDISQVWNIFPLIHQAVRNKEDIVRVTREVIEDFDEENVVYLELRTTPKALNDCGKKEYLEGILEEIARMEGIRKEIAVRILVSIDRARGIKEAEENLAIYEELKANPKLSKFLVGIDYSGNCYKSGFGEYSEIFTRARGKGIKLAVHTGEIPGEETEKETDLILNFKPDRIGHFNYYSSEALDRLKEQGIIVEVCPSSNFFTKKLKSFEDHHLPDFVKNGIPFTICTDDKAIFKANLSEEWQLVDQTFALGFPAIKQILVNAASTIFDGEQTCVILSKLNSFNFV